MKYLSLNGLELERILPSVCAAWLQLKNVLVCGISSFSHLESNQPSIIRVSVVLTRFFQNRVVLFLERSLTIISKKQCLEFIFKRKRKCRSRLKHTTATESPPKKAS